MSKYAVPIIGLVIGAWLLFDGIRAVSTGMYTTPATGAYAGQLGPWSYLLRGMSLDPLSSPVKLAHIILGLAWVACAVWFVVSPAQAWWPLLVTALASLWYLPFGTIASIAVIVMLWLPANRAPT
jgi:hypothetical protein